MLVSQVVDQYSSFQSLHGWMDDIQFYVLFNSISVISGQWVGNNERLYAVETRYR